ncbi:hypothetical protein ACOMHN_002314 [Nucella lapillus]
MLYLIALAVLAFYFATFYASQSFNETQYTWGRTPPIVAILIKILVRIIRRRQGKVYQKGSALLSDTGSLGGRGNDLKKDADCWTDEDGVVYLKPSPDEIVTISGYRVTHEQVAQYKTICSTKNHNKAESKTDNNGAVPLCFPDSLFMYNLLLLVCKPSFKVSPLDLIHVGQTVKKHGDLQQLLEGPCALEARTTAYRVMPKGVEVDVSVRIIAAASELCVWSGVTTLLSRSRHVQSGSGQSSEQQHRMDGDWESQDEVCSQQIDATADTGLRYAEVSGDWNPHHLYPWTARLLGYRAPIAHGLWTLATAVDLLSGNIDDSSRFTEVECRFKHPFFLPGTALLQHYTDGNKVKFRVIDSETQAPYLVGIFT